MGEGEDVLLQFDRQTEGWLRDNLGEARFYKQMIRLLRSHMDDLNNSFETYQDLSSMNEILNIMELFTDENIRSIKFQLNIKD